MSQATFPNLQTLSSSALTPEQMQQVFQTLVIQIFGYAPTPNPPPPSSSAVNPYSVVRCGFQQEGEPGPDISLDQCIITAFPQNDAYSRVRDSQFQVNAADQSGDTLLQPESYTQVWRIHFTVYGPNAWDNARLIVSTIFLQNSWAQAWLATNCPQSGVPVVQPIYPIADPARPIRNQELFQRRWWPRVDLDLKFNEFVAESILATTAASDQITINTYAPTIAETFTVPNNS